MEAKWPRSGVLRTLTAETGDVNNLELVRFEGFDHPELSLAAAAIEEDILGGTCKSGFQVLGTFQE